MICGGLVTLGVPDPSQAVRFYIETLGMKLVEARDDEVILDAGDGFLVALRKGAPVKTGEPTVTFRAKVPIDEAIAIYENRGVSFTTTRTASGTVARFHDPDGSLLALAG